MANFNSNMSFGGGERVSFVPPHLTLQVAEDLIKNSVWQGNKVSVTSNNQKYLLTSETAQEILKEAKIPQDKIKQFLEKGLKSKVLSEKEITAKPSEEKPLPTSIRQAISNPNTTFYEPKMKYVGQAASIVPEHLKLQVGKDLITSGKFFPDEQVYKVTSGELRYHLSPEIAKKLMDEAKNQEKETPKKAEISTQTVTSGSPDIDQIINSLSRSFKPGDQVSEINLKTNGNNIDDIKIDDLILAKDSRSGRNFVVKFKGIQGDNVSYEDPYKNGVIKTASKDKVWKLKTTVDDAEKAYLKALIQGINSGEKVVRDMLIGFQIRKSSYSDNEYKQWVDLQTLDNRMRITVLGTAGKLDYDAFQQDSFKLPDGKSVKMLEYNLDKALVAFFKSKVQK